MSTEDHWKGVLAGVLVAAVLFGIGVWYMKYLQRQRQGSPPPSSSSSSPPRRKTAKPSYPRGSLPGSFEGDANSARRSGVEAPPSPAQVSQRLLANWKAFAPTWSTGLTTALAQQAPEPEPEPESSSPDVDVGVSRPASPTRPRPVGSE